MSVWSTYQPATSCKISKKCDESVLGKLHKYGKQGNFGYFWSNLPANKNFPKASLLCQFELLINPQLHVKYQKKSNEAILRKLIKHRKLVHFRSFWSIFETRIFFKNRALSLFSTYQLLISCKISKNSNEPILRKLAWKKWMDGQTDKRMDRQTWNHRTLAGRGSKK